MIAFRVSAIFSSFVFITLLTQSSISSAKIIVAESRLDIPSAQTIPAIDGVFDANEWSDSKNVALNYVTRPFENTKPPVDTTVYFKENGETLFVAFVAKDPTPADIRAFLRDRDRSFGEDLVGIKLDPYFDGRLAYQFFINPLGVQTDSIENEMTGSESTSWNGIWNSAGQLTEDGFVVEVAIPLRLMNFVENPGKKSWGVEFVRFYPRGDNYRISHLPNDRNNSCTLCQMGELVGFEKAKQQQNLAIVPTLVLGGAQTKDPIADTDWESETNQEVGVDVNWSITPEMTFSGTLNPDFSQVEADVPQLAINNTFALFFSERRPFFVENADYFSSIQNLVYTRNINAPDYGAKVTGRLNNHSIGVFVANDESTTFVVPGNLGSQVAFVDEKTTNMAARYRYDVSNEFSIGTITTVRDSDRYSNILAGVDMRYLITSQDTLRFQYTRSETDYPDELFLDFCSNECERVSDLSETALRTITTDKFSGTGYRILYDRDTRDYFVNLRRIVDNDGYRADLGFVNGIDRKRWIAGGGYRWWNEESWWNRIQINGDWDITHNVNGEVLERELEGYFNVRADLQSFFEIGFLKRARVGLRQGFDGELANRLVADLDGEQIEQLLGITNNTQMFDETSMSTFFSIQPNATYEVSSFMRIGDSVDFANNRLGDQVYIDSGIDINLGTHFQMSFEHTYSELDADDQPLFIANLVDARFTYQFDPRQFVRLIMSYSNVQRNQENYQFEVDEKFSSLGFQLLYSYKVNPLTKFFVGYSQSAFDNDDLDRLRVDGRSLFMKFSYAWLP